LLQVATKYRLSKGHIQSLQQQAASFAGMLTTFCEKMGPDWSSMQTLIAQFQPRLAFGVHLDLVDLMHIPYMTSTFARGLHQKGMPACCMLLDRLGQIL